VSAARPITFDDFQPGKALGEADVAVDAAMLASLQAIYGVTVLPGQPVPLPLCTALMMRAYLQVVSARPPGNVHARQWLQLHGPLQAGDCVRTRVQCLAKELKAGRRWVTLEAQGEVAGRPVYTGRLTLVWAA
jgi:acyl dehydratase